MDRAERFFSVAERQSHRSRSFNMLQRWSITPTDEMTYKLAVFKNITHATLALRRAEIQKARLIGHPTLRTPR
jgi:hypothetical protein